MVSSGETQLRRVFTVIDGSFANPRINRKVAAITNSADKAAVFGTIADLTLHGSFTDGTVSYGDINDALEETLNREVRPFPIHQLNNWNTYSFEPAGFTKPLPSLVRPDAKRTDRTSRLEVTDAGLSEGGALAGEALRVAARYQTRLQEIFGSAQSTGVTTVRAPLARAKIISDLLRNSDLSQAQLQASVGLSETSIRAHLQNLDSSGLIEYVQPGARQEFIYNRTSKPGVATNQMQPESKQLLRIIEQSRGKMSLDDIVAVMSEGTSEEGKALLRTQLRKRLHSLSRNGFLEIDGARSKHDKPIISIDHTRDFWVDVIGGLATVIDGMKRKDGWRLGAYQVMGAHILAGTEILTEIVDREGAIYPPIPQLIQNVLASAETPLLRVEIQQQVTAMYPQVSVAGVANALHHLEAKGAVTSTPLTKKQFTYSLVQATSKD